MRTFLVVPFSNSLSFDASGRWPCGFYSQLRVPSLRRRDIPLLRFIDLRSRSAVSRSVRPPFPCSLLVLFRSRSDARRFFIPSSASFPSKTKGSFFPSLGPVFFLNPADIGRHDGFGILNADPSHLICAELGAGIKLFRYVHVSSRFGHTTRSSFPFIFFVTIRSSP